MMKKFFAVMLPSIGVFFGGQVAEVSKASAADVYAYTEDGKVTKKLFLTCTTTRGFIKYKLRPAE